MRKYIGLGLGFIIAMGAAQSAHATVFTVTDTSDSYVQGDGVCSLREAIDTANYNDCWTDCGCGQSDALDHVSLSSGTTYTLNDRLEIWDAVVLYGNYAVVRGSGGFFHGLIIQSTWYVELSNLALENFRYAALGIDTGAAAYTSGLEVRNNPFSVGGGQNSGIALLQGSYLYLYGANIHNNGTSLKGGGIFIGTDAWVDLEASLIQYNQASQYGGGVHNLGHFHCYGGSLIYGNSADLDGGGLLNATGAVFDGPSNVCHIYGNTSTGGADDIGGHP